MIVSDGFPLSVSAATTAAVNRIGNADGCAPIWCPGEQQTGPGWTRTLFDPTQFAPVNPASLNRAGTRSLRRAWRPSTWECRSRFPLGAIVPFNSVVRSESVQPRELRYARYQHYQFEWDPESQRWANQQYADDRSPGTTRVALAVLERDKTNVNSQPPTPNSQALSGVTLGVGGWELGVDTAASFSGLTLTFSGGFARLNRREVMTTHRLAVEGGARAGIGSRSRAAQRIPPGISGAWWPRATCSRRALSAGSVLALSSRTARHRRARSRDP